MRRLILTLCILLNLKPGHSQTRSVLITGLDHIPVVVHNPDNVAAFYKLIGFSIKPGRRHPNSIRNQHIKFQDGTELELITADTAKDELSTEYCNMLKTAEGPAFIGLFSKNIPAVEKQLATAYKHLEADNNAVSFALSSSLHPLFIGRRNLSPTDKPEHFAHPNTAWGLIAVWLAPTHTDDYKNVLQTLGVPLQQKQVNFHGVNVNAKIGLLSEGTIYILPPSYQVIKGRPIIGVTLKVTDLSTVQSCLQKSSIKAIKSGNSIFLPPTITHGFWLEFTEVKKIK
ncbi:VOC family protein [Chitinophaga arvensicola]|uniref:Glyoxalase-like domain-containing protein n=1 Tax=Chitinophaga arvensicola TaxID=29529 RepID=A0A1I0S9J8_9BACT|nr:VOC family protein [Chitinophaga arvensicola]SEW52850.1 Glyoxalase-like domain-containing protein [Chitinophaga arvensicola]